MHVDLLNVSTFSERIWAKGDLIIMPLSLTFPKKRLNAAVLRILPQKSKPGQTMYMYNTMKITYPLKIVQ